MTDSLDILDMMIERVYKRRDEYKTFIVSPLPRPGDLGESMILGAFSVIGMSSKSRYIFKPVLVPIDHTSETPSTLARDYLMLKYKRGPIISHIQRLKIEKIRKPAPNYAQPAEFSNGFYIDIRSTYWTIMNAIGWNVDYYPGKWIKPGKKPVDFPFPDNKTARNCLVSAGAGGSIPIYNYPGGLSELKKGNPLANLSLISLINDILNAVAFEAVKLGAVYVNSDGYIAPSESIAAQIFDLLNNWGLPARIKAQGRGVVVGSGTYQVGSARSGLMEFRELQRPINEVRRPSYSKWLKNVYSFWAKRA